MAGILPLTAVLLMTGHVVDGCRFPDYVQSTDGRLGVRRDWRGHVTQDGDGDVVTFEGRFMRVLTRIDANSSTTTSVRRECLLTIGLDKYLCVERSISATSSSSLAPHMVYLCLQFIQRSSAVLQIRTSIKSSSQDPRLCSEHHLHLDEWPLVDRLAMTSVSAKCPLESAGYDVRLYDRMTRRGVCDVYQGHTRLEAGCMQARDDDVMLFRFRFPECVPSSLRMDVEQRVRCLATWTDGSDIFTVITSSDQRQITWCLRLPTLRRASVRSGHSFTAHLYRDLFCDKKPVQDVSQNAVVIDIKRSAVEHGSSRVCTDDYEGCKWMEHRPTCPSSHCAQTCQICTSTLPTTCTFGADIIGHWRRPEARDPVVVIDDHSIAWHGGDGVRVVYRCVQWTSTNNTAVTSPNTHIVAVDLSNGCRPRYACVEFDGRHSASGLLLYRLSDVRPWPFDVHIDPVAQCSMFHFPPVLDDVTKTSRDVLVASSRKYVDCQLDISDSSWCLAVQIGNRSERCLVSVENLPVGDARGGFRITSYNCSTDADDDDVTESEDDFRCLSRSPLVRHHRNLSVVMLLTESAPTVRFDCWIVVRGVDSVVVYRLRLTDCSHSSYQEIVAARLVPTATYQQLPLSSSATVAAAAGGGGANCRDLLTSTVVHTPVTAATVVAADVETATTTMTSTGSNDAASSTDDLHLRANTTTAFHSTTGGSSRWFFTGSAGSSSSSSGSSGSSAVESGLLLNEQTSVVWSLERLATTAPSMRPFESPTHGVSYVRHYRGHQQLSNGTNISSKRSPLNVCLLAVLLTLHQSRLLGGRCLIGS